MKTITDRVRAAWAKLPPRARSAVRHFVVTFAVAFAVAAQPSLKDIYAAPDLATAKDLAIAAFYGAGAAAVRVCVPLAVVYGKALVAWALARLSG
jgi:hypothetical protein